MQYLFYRFGPDEPAAAVAALPPGYSHLLWRPSALTLRPPGARLYPYWVFWVMHQARIFASRDYAVLLVFFGRELVHQAAITPADFRYPFMSAADLQVGNVLTHPQHRGRGLATFSIQKIVSNLRASGRAFWYVTDENNTASRRAVEKAGFRLAGQGVRRSLGLPFFVRYRILSPAPAGSVDQARRA